MNPPSPQANDVWCPYNPLDDFLPSSRVSSTGEPQVRRRPSSKKPALDSSAHWKWNNVNFKSQSKKKDNQKVWSQMIDHFNLRNRSSLSSSSSSIQSFDSNIPSPSQTPDFSPDPYNWQCAQACSSKNSTSELSLDGCLLSEGFGALPHSPSLSVDDIFDFDEFQIPQSQQQQQQQQEEQEQHRKESLQHQPPKSEAVVEIEAFLSLLTKSFANSQEMCCSSSSSLNASSIPTVLSGVDDVRHSRNQEIAISSFSFDSNSYSYICGPLPTNELFFS
jgi:hypothetical protein